nr:hypothetical protein [Brucella anthropi]
MIVTAIVIFFVTWVGTKGIKDNKKWLVNTSYILIGIYVILSIMGIIDILPFAIEKNKVAPVFVRMVLPSVIGLIYFFYQMNKTKKEISISGSDYQGS